MAPRKQLAHKTWAYLDPQYDSYTNPVTPHEQPYIVAGSNVLTSRRGWVERMPGSSLYEATATQFDVGKRIFLYKKWDGTTYLIANAVTSTQSIVYKLLIGTDTAFSSIHTSSTPQTFDFVVANNYLYFSNGADTKRYDGLSAVANWGISSTGANSITTGPTSPGTAADTGATWTNPNNVFASDDARATATATSGSTSQLNITNFGFAINANDTIDGIKVEVECSSTSAQPVLVAQIIRGGLIVGNHKEFTITSSEAYVTLGSSTDLWSATLEPSDVNLTTFGVGISFYDSSGAAPNGSVDHVRVTIYSSRGAAPTTATSATGITAVTGWKYVYCYKNSGTGHLSSPSPVSASTGAVSNKQVDVTGSRSTDTQVDRVRVFRTTDGGDGIYYGVGEVANPGSGTWTYNDTTADTALDTSYANQAPPPLNNDPPIGMYGLKSFASRIWGFNASTLYYSGWEEINAGLEEESFPSGVTGNFWTAPQEITNLAVLPDKLLIFCRSKIFQATDNGGGTFSFTPLFNNMGSAVKQGKGVVEDGERVFWLNYDNRLWVTDGNSKELVSESVTDEFITIDPTDFSMCVHRYGEYNWLVVADNAGSTVAHLSTSATNGATASTVAQDVPQADEEWTNPSNALTSNNSYATVGLDESLGQRSKWLRVVGFGFAIPSGVTVTGIEVRVEAKRAAGITGLSGGVRLVRAGTSVAATEKAISLASFGTSDTTTTFGGAGHTWDSVWDSSDINSATFGVEMDLIMGTGGGTFSVDSIDIKIYYGGTSASARWFVLDLNTGKWMPPWTRSANHLCSAELAAGQFTLMYMSYDQATASKTNVRQVDIPPRTTTYQDTSTNYPANAVFALTDLAPAGLVYEAEYVGYERNDSGSPTAPILKLKSDEDNSAVSWGAVTAGTQSNPTLRTVGSTLVEKWAYFKQNCRRILVRFDWTGENKNFKLISMDLNGRIIGGDD